MKYLILGIYFCSCISTLFSQPIPRYFFAQNAWMSDTLGNIFDCPGASKGLSCKLYGKIHENNNWEKVRRAGVKLIRFGGEHGDENMPTRRQFLQIIDSARSKGIEPLLQVPYNNNFYTADTAAELVKFINVTMRRRVKYWTIGNEPDLPPPNGYGYYTASPIADYTKQFATKMKKVDSTIITIGPELTFYDNRNNLITELTTPGGYYDITGRVPGHSYYYLDLISFHSYPFGGTQKREELISVLRDPWHISNMLDQLNARLDSCNDFHHRGKKSLRIALTETNLNYKNSPDPELGAHSFIAGQFWCELMAVALERKVEMVAFWSTVEASLGFIDEKTGKLWPTYYHYKVMADHFKGNYYKCEVPKDIKLVKALASADSSLISVLVMNQNNTKGSYKYSLVIGEGKVDGVYGVPIKVTTPKDLQGQIVFNDIIDDESTTLLVFNFFGTIVKKITYKKSDGSNAVPRTIKDKMIPIYVYAGPDVRSSEGKEITLTARTTNKKAIYNWYEGSSMTPLNSKATNNIKVSPSKNTTYRLVVTVDGFKVQDEITVTVQK